MTSTAVGLFPPLIFNTLGEEEDFKSGISACVGFQGVKTLTAKCISMPSSFRLSYTKVGSAGVAWGAIPRPTDPPAARASRRPLPRVAALGP